MSDDRPAETPEIDVHVEEPTSAMVHVEKADSAIEPSSRDKQVALALDPAYTNASGLRLTPEEAAAIAAPFDDSEIEIRPDGLIYIPHIAVSDRLTKVLGPGQWAMIRRRTWQEQKEKAIVVYAEYVMKVRNCFVGESIGSGSYYPDNDKQTYSDALEACRGECLRRIAGKDFACGSAVWRPAFARAWVAKFAVQVWCETPDHKKRPMWRRKDSPPIDMFPWKESAPHRQPGHEHDGAIMPSTPKPPVQRARPTTQHKTVSESDIGAPDASSAMKRLHAVGRQCYGDKWDTKRHELCKVVTKGRTTSALELTADEMAYLITGIEKKIASGTTAGTTGGAGSTSYAPPEATDEQMGNMARAIEEAEKENDIQALKDIQGAVFEDPQFSKSQRATLATKAGDAINRLTIAHDSADLHKQLEEAF